MALAYIQPIFLTPAAAGGTIVVYLAGSTDQAPVYSPVTEEVSYNPVPINSAGFSDGFKVETDNVYDLKVYKANGSLYLTRENVSVLGGSAGAVGPQGPQGIRGEKGDKGDTGAAGRDGTNGTDGADGVDGADGISLVSIRVDETSNTGKILYNLSSDPNNWIDAGDIVPAGLGQVKVGPSDSLGFLEEKVVAGTDISIGNSGTQLTVSNTAPETFKTQASQYATVKDFLNMLIEGTSGVTVSTSADFNKIVISGAGIGGSGFEPKGAWTSGTTYSEGEGVWYYDDSVSPVINRYYVATATTTTNPYTDGTGWVIMFSIDQLGDQMVKLDNDDSTTGFLLSKLIAGQGITFTRTVDAGGDFITIEGQPSFSIGINGTDKTISDLSNVIDVVDGEVIEVAWDGTNVKINHDTYAESGTTITQTATGLPKFDNYGHYKGESDAIEISDVSGLSTALTTAGDGQVAIQAGDAKGYLEDKIIVAGTVEKATVGSPSNKMVQIIGNGKVNVSSLDAPGYLEDKVIAGDNVTISIEDENTTNEKLKISVVLPDLDDDYPIIAEYGNPSSIYFPSNNSGAAILKIAGKSTEFALNTQRIDNRVGGNSFDTSTGIFYPQKDGYYVCTFNAFVHPSSSTSKDSAFYVSCKVETSYDGITWAGMGSDSSKGIQIEYPLHATYPNGYGKPLTFHMVVDMRDNAYSGNHRMARIIIQQNSFGAGYNNSCYFMYPQFAWYELKKPVGIQGPKGDTGEQGPAGTVAALDDIPDVDVATATDGQVLTFDAGTDTWIPTTVSGGTGDNKVKVNAGDTTPGYLIDKIEAASGSPLTVTVVGETLVLDAIEADISDPLIKTIALMSENGVIEYTGSCYSATYADGEWDTGTQQNTTDTYYRVTTDGRGTITKVKFYVSQLNGADLGIGEGYYGAIRIGLFTTAGVCKGMTAWTRGISTTGTHTLDMVACPGQDLTIERNTEYWIGTVARGMVLVSYNKAASAFQTTDNLRYSVTIRSARNNASWSPNFWLSTGGGFVQNKVAITLMGAT